MNERKVITGIIAATLVLIIGGVFLATGTEDKENQQKMNDKVLAVSDDKYFDWGEININDGVVEKEFEIKNDGEETLTLSNVVTSCMCTTAILIKGDEESPEFGMHTKSRYEMGVASGETAKLKVTFDPAFHGPSGVGPITRQVTVETNDPSNPKLSYTLTAMVRK